jgi:ABC-type Fe3+-hydroxamate transport system substrate-binding protein
MRTRVEADDLGLEVRPGRPVRRIVSLVPSLTEAVAATAPGLIVGATAWCTHPADLDTERIGGTKNPDTSRIAGLRPDLVIANEEENRAADLEALRGAGVPVWVTRVRTLDEAFGSLHRLLTTACGLEPPEWLDQARAAWSPAEAIVRRRAIVPIWRRPWMVLGRDTFAGDVLARLGVVNVYADHAERYPAIPLSELQAARADLVVLPDEPYAFAPEDGPEAFPALPAALVSGRHLTWYGPSLAEARDVLARQLAGGVAWRRAIGGTAADPV